MLKKILKASVSRCALLHILYTFCREMIRGYCTYKQIECGTGGAKIFLQYYQGTGDVYLSAAYLKHCEERGNIDGNAVFAVNGANAVNVTTLMKLKNISVVMLSNDKAYSLVQLTRFIGTDMVNIVHLHYMSDYPMYTNFLITLAGLHDIGFMDLYREIVFGGEQFKLPAPRWGTGNAPQLSTLDKKKKALLAPAANSITEGPDNLFWSNLAQQLKQAGYRVYTNISGDEERIAETEPIFIPYMELEIFLDDCAVFIGYRSGLCDLVATLRCKKIILYPEVCWPSVNGLNIGSTLTVFSLNKMGICEDAIELEYSENKRAEILSVIQDSLSD